MKRRNATKETDKKNWTWNERIQLKCKMRRASRSIDSAPAVSIFFCIYRRPSAGFSPVAVEPSTVVALHKLRIDLYLLCICLSVPYDGAGCSLAARLAISVIVQLQTRVMIPFKAVTFFSACSLCCRWHCHGTDWQNLFQRQLAWQYLQANRNIQR